jgi:hypothetical protein
VEKTQFYGGMLVKTLKNISFLLAFACAMPIVAIDQSEGQKEALVAMMQEAEQQNVDATNAVPDKTEPSMKDILDAAHNYAVAGTTAWYGLAGGLVASHATLNATASLPMALLAGAGTMIASTSPMIYFYNKYKNKFGEAFKTVQNVAGQNMFMYTLPLMLGTCGYICTNWALKSSYLLGIVISKIAQALGLNTKTIGFTAASTAIAIPSYIEAAVQSDKEKPVNTYTTALKFMYAYARNCVILAFASAAVAGVLVDAQK